MMKNFSPPSFPRMSDLRNAAIRNPGADTSSSARNSIRRFREAGISVHPRNAVNSRK